MMNDDYICIAFLFALATYLTRKKLWSFCVESEYYRFMTMVTLDMQIVGEHFLSASPGRVKNIHFSISSRLALGPTQAPVQWVLGVKH
jgi:hypothetical protein